ncbi:XrtA system polysaccharide chain length determinant [Sphingorhabdus sp. 109]|jgi:polysaccharide chain length determinant protein (PEP-CTERM system associated)|uniref:XrtA system polysaccharide chain length determinant n=1 Tax=Sphingorhabdus sp. 109 TaxID=2653173 RepID=UPI0012F3248B|nr:XrtA system polysaccharide chain length determinant [Sphingorhabdus sp. 109]VWX56902.1 Chain-length determining protein [Sphingorhabdus sp. 109]
MNGLYDEFKIALYSVWNRRWLALAVAWGLCLLGWLVVALIPNSYESQARISVEMQSILSDKVGVDERERKKNMERVQETLASTINLEKVVRGTALNQSVATDRELASKVEMLRENIEIKSEKDNLFEITAKSSASNFSDAENAVLARDIVQKMIDIFVEENLSGDRDETSQTIKFLDAQLAQREKELQEVEQKRVQFETENLGLLPGVGSISQRMEAARAELAQIESQISQASGSLAALNGQLAGTPPLIATPGVGGGGARGQLAQLEANLAGARARGWTDSHPDIISMKKEIAALRVQAGKESAGGGGYRTPNPAYSSLQSMRAERQASLAALQARKNALQSDMTQLASKQTLEPGVAAEMSRINRDHEVLKEQYDKLLADREQIKLRGQVESETDSLKFRVIDPPSSPRSPAAPNRPLLLAMVLIAGIGGGVGTAFAMGHVQTSYPTAARLEKASGLPVIGSVSQIVTSAQREIQKKKLRLFFGTSGALFGVFGMLMVVEFIQRGMVA